MRKPDGVRLVPSPPLPLAELRASQCERVVCRLPDRVVARFDHVRRGAIVEPRRTWIADDGVETRDSFPAGVTIETIVQRAAHFVGERPPPQSLLERRVQERHGPMVDATIPAAELLHRFGG